MPLIIPNFITVEEQAELIAWEEKVRPDLSRNGTGSGGSIKPHVDQIENNVHHVRCNVFVSTTEHGGIPIIDGTPYAVAARSLLCFFASEQMHSCDPVEDPTRRIVCSYGYEVDGDFLRAFYPVWGAPLVEKVVTHTG